MVLTFSPLCRAFGLSDRFPRGQSLPTLLNWKPRGYCIAGHPLFVILSETKNLVLKNQTNFWILRFTQNDGGK